MQELIEKRTRNSKTHLIETLPDGRQRFAWDGTIGSIHYRDNPKDDAEQWKKIDNVFEPAIAPWDWRMLNAGYHVRVKEDFTAGQIIEFEKQGETVQFQPMALEWTNDLDQIQPVSMPQEVAPVITNPEVDLLPAVGMPSHQGSIRWNDGYGEGLDFEWRCTSTRLIKILEIENLNKLPTPEQYILDGGNPVLRLNLIFDPSSGVDIYIDDELWDKTTKKQTFSIIEFRKDGEVLWGFMPLRYWGSNPEVEENEGQSVATLEKSGNSLYISIRVPYEWLQNAVYPVFIDIPVEEHIEATADDAHSHRSDDALFDTTGEYLQAWSHTDLMNYNYLSAGLRFQTVDIPQGSTITTAYQEVYVYGESADDLNLVIYGNDVGDADDFSTTPYIYVEAQRPRTTASAPWVADGIGVGWKGSSIEIKTVIEEIVGRVDWAAEHDLVLLFIPNTDAEKKLTFYAWEHNDHSLAAKLHIEYLNMPPAAAGGGGGLAAAAKVLLT